MHLAYIYIRGEMVDGAKILNEALKAARAKGFLGKKILGSGYDLEMHVHRGAGAYICGEETGLIESLEGKRPYPRIKPPYFPAAIGLYGLLAYTVARRTHDKTPFPQAGLGLAG